ncbi:MAG: hypothetical protein R3A46_15265 [Thermomicrobiales bacterium]
MSDGARSTKPRNRGSRVRVYERPEPPFFQRHPVIVIIVASLVLAAMLFLTFFVL